jgi:hypothetical protein
MRGGISLIFPHAFMAGIGKSLIFLPLQACHLYDFVRTAYGYHKEYINYHILDFATFGSTSRTPSQEYCHIEIRHSKQYLLNQKN